MIVSSCQRNQQPVQKCSRREQSSLMLRSKKPFFLVCFFVYCILQLLVRSTSCCRQRACDWDILLLYYLLLSWSGVYSVLEPGLYTVLIWRSCHLFLQLVSLSCRLSALPAAQRFWFLSLMHIVGEPLTRFSWDPLTYFLFINDSNKWKYALVLETHSTSSALTLNAEEKI